MKFLKQNAYSNRINNQRKEGRELSETESAREAFKLSGKKGSLISSSENVIIFISYGAYI